MRKLTHSEVLARQKTASRQPKLPMVVVLDNIRSIYNVGSIFRVADGVGVSTLWLCGITPYPPESRLSKIALGAEDVVNWDHAADALKVVKRLKSEGYQIVLLEQTDQSVLYQNFFPQRPLCLVLGNEVRGVDDRIVGLADAAIEIDMAGIKNSLNVAVAFGVVAYHFRAQMRLT